MFKTHVQPCWQNCHHRQCCFFACHALLAQWLSHALERTSEYVHGRQLMIIFKLIILFFSIFTVRLYRVPLTLTRVRALNDCAQNGRRTNIFESRTLSMNEWLLPRRALLPEDVLPAAEEAEPVFRMGNIQDSSQKKGFAICEI